MTILSEAMAEAEKAAPNLHSLARVIASRLLLPGRPLTRPILESYLRRALRNGAWQKLPSLHRALLYAASKTIGRVRSPVLRDLLEEILLEIELATTRGKAVYYGIILLAKQSPHLIGKLLAKAGSLLPRLLFLGISYLNNPPAYRIYG